MAKANKTTLAARQIVKKWMATANLHATRLEFDGRTSSQVQAAVNIQRTIDKGSMSFDRPHELVKFLALALKSVQKLG
jgi:hypothetical protein